MPPHSATPVDGFRELLALDLAEREEHLADKKGEQQDYLRELLNEFDALTPTQRELRLRLLELRYRLLPLLSIEPTERLEKFGKIPADQRQFIEAQLRFWDQMSERDRELALKEPDSWSFLPFLARQSAPDMTPPPLPERTRLLEAEIAKWRALAPEARERSARGLLRFLELDASQQGRVLDSVSAPQRGHLEQIAAAYRQLSPQKRRECLVAFARLAAIDEDERKLFWRKAARWEEMSPEQRAAWRSFTAQLPPLPPGAGPVLDLPPIPTEGSETARAAAW
jgi:hypothetical protein